MSDLVGRKLRRRIAQSAKRHRLSREDLRTIEHWVVGIKSGRALLLAFERGNLEIAYVEEGEPTFICTSGAGGTALSRRRGGGARTTSCCTGPARKE